MYIAFCLLHFNLSTKIYLLCLVIDICIFIHPQTSNITNIEYLQRNLTYIYLHAAWDSKESAVPSQMLPPKRSSASRVLPCIHYIIMQLQVRSFQNRECGFFFQRFWFDFEVWFLILWFWFNCILLFWFEIGIHSHTFKCTKCRFILSCIWCSVLMSRFLDTTKIPKNEY